MIIDHMFHIVIDMFDIMISMVNNLLYVIIITLIYGIKMTWKLPNILASTKAKVVVLGNFYNFLVETFSWNIYEL
jgi:hypothetical protein